MKALKNWIVVLQFVALVEIAFGLLMLPALMHADAGDSGSVYRRIDDLKLRADIRQRYKQQWRDTSHLVAEFGVVVFVLSTLAAFGARRVETASKQTRAMRVGSGLGDVQ